MPIVVHRFDEPERFVAGTVGEPGQRTFFLQARDGARVTTVALEKQQVSVLAERVEMLLDEALRRRSGGDVAIPAVAPVDSRDPDPLDQPIVEEFRVGTITLSWDSEAGLVVIELFPVSEEAVVVVEFEDEAPPDMETTDVEVEIDANEVLIVTMRPSYARSFVQRALSVVAAGRPPCPFCGNPLDPEGHLCPRANGYRRLAG